MKYTSLLLALWLAKKRAESVLPSGNRPASGSLSATTAEDNVMPSEFEFLDKHFYDTEEVYLAAQAARERFGNYPQARTSTVIYNIGWQELTKSIEEAVINYTFGQIFPDARTFAYMGEYHGNPQWNIVVTGLNYVNASVQIVGGVREYQVAAYINGTVVINARVVGNNPPMLGEIIHLEATVGDFVEVVELKS